jgi:penicillin-binding protein 1A
MVRSLFNTIYKEAKISLIFGSIINALASLLLCLVVSGLPSSIIPSSNGGDNLAIFRG